MTAFLLVRHAAHALGPDVLAGRTPGVGLSAEGEAAARRLGEALRDVPLDAVVSSPLERTLTTARALGEPVVREALAEVDYGDWTGRRVADLDGDPAWRSWNERRGTARVPNGESMAEVQERAVAEVERLAREHGGTVAVVTHAEVVRALLAHYLGVPLDLCLRIEVAPASVSVVRLAGGVPSVGLVNGLSSSLQDRGFH